jgi:molybdate transport system substrate-binding protein
MTIGFSAAFAAKLGLAALLVSAGTAGAAELKVMASAAVKEAYLELVPAFEKSSGHKVTTIWAGTVDIMKRIGGGEAVDLVIASAAALDELTKQGRIVPGSRVAIAKSGVGAAVKAGAPRPDISSGEKLKASLLAARSIGYSTGPSGVYLAGLFQRVGIAEQIKTKVVQVPVGQSVGEAVARGEAEIGFQQVSELLPVKGIDFLGPLSSDVQHVTVFSAGLHKAATSPEAAKALVDFLRSPQAVTVIKHTGMEPG